MPTEIEHKFLVTGDAWRGTTGVRYRQGYLARSAECVVRVRVGGGRGFITTKGATLGHARLEFEYPIPEDDAAEMIDTLCGRRVVEKTRFRIPYRGFVWEVDEFHGENAGLVLAEIELAREGQAFDKPSWVGRDVSHDHRYANSALAIKPFRHW